jgi:hypothetical protein
MANSFAGDYSCKAVWRFESGALTADSQNSNTLTSHEASADSVNFKEGACSAVLAGGAYPHADYFSIADASLMAGFPLKSDDSSQQFSFTVWIRPTAVTGRFDIFSNMEYGAQHGLRAHIYNGNLTISWGYGTNQESWTVCSVTIDQWYHISIIGNGIAKTIHIRIWDDTGASVSNYDHTFTNALVLTANPFYIGIGNSIANPFIGNIDEFVAFNAQLSDTTVDAIRGGTYDGTQHLYPQSIGSAEYLGHVSLSLVEAYPTGIESEEAFGLPCATTLIIAAAGIVSSEGVGTPAVLATQILVSIGIVSGTTFGTPTAQNMMGEPITGVGGFKFAGTGTFTDSMPGVLIVEAQGGFRFSGVDLTGSPSATLPAVYLQTGRGGYLWGGRGRWDLTAPADIPALVVAATARGGFRFGGQGTFSLVTPPQLFVVGSGGFRMGGFRIDRPQVTYLLPITTVGSRVVFALGGEGVWYLPTARPLLVTPSKGVFGLGGAGIVSVIFPPVLMITAAGGYCISGTGQESPAPDVWVLTGNSFEPSMYTNYGFNSFAKMGHLYFGLKDDGLYLLDGPDDDGEKIVPAARIGPINLGNANMKRLRSINVGDDGAGMRVRVEGNGKEAVSPVIAGKAFAPYNIQARSFMVDVSGFDKLSHIEITALTVAWD